MTWSTQTLRTVLSMPMASPPLDVGEPDFLTFRTVTFWMMMLLDSRMWMPSWSKTAPLPTPMMRDVADLLELDHAGGGVAAAARHLAGVAVVDGPSTSMVIGVLLLARPHRAAWIAVPVAGPHRLPARAAGGPAVLGRVAGGAAGRRRRLRASAGPPRSRHHGRPSRPAPPGRRSATGRLIVASPSHSSRSRLRPDGHRDRTCRRTSFENWRQSIARISSRSLAPW